MELKFKQRQVDAAGFKVRYWEAGNGRPVIMLDETEWRNTKLHEALAEKYHIFTLEIPGTGDSATNTESQSIGDLASVISTAASSLTSERYTLIGTSFGAHLAIWQAAQSPDSVEALILISPTAILYQGVIDGTTAQEFHDSLFAHAENAQQFVALNPDVFAKESALKCRLGSGTRGYETESKFADIHCPTLAIFGRNDRLVSPEAARVYREKIPNSNIAIVYDAGHCIVGDRPEALVNSVVDYSEHWETFIVGHQSGLINP